jgi:hypothetical protein
MSLSSNILGGFLQRRPSSETCSLIRLGISRCFANFHFANTFLLESCVLFDASRRIGTFVFNGLGLGQRPDETSVRPFRLALNGSKTMGEIFKERIVRLYFRSFI